MVTNLALAKHLDGRAVAEEEIKVSLQVTFPSGLGGVITCVCVSVSSEEARFESTNKEYPRNFSMKFGQADFSREDFDLLSEALDAFNSWGRQPTKDQRAIVRKAYELGYAHYMSYTQASWSVKGVEAYSLSRKST